MAPQALRVACSPEPTQLQQLWIDGMAFPSAYRLGMVGGPLRRERKGGREKRVGGLESNDTSLNILHQTGTVGRRRMGNGNTLIERTSIAFMFYV